MKTRNGLQEKEKKNNEEKDQAKEEAKVGIVLSPKQMAVLFLVSAIAYSPFFLVPNIGGWDSYHYLNALKVPESSFLWVKIGLFLLMYASVVFIGSLGMVFHPKGWLAGIAVFACPFFVVEFWKFETEQLAYPILFAATWLFFSKHRLLALAVLVPAILLWQGSAIYLVLFAINWLPMLPALIPLAYIAWTKLGNILPNPAVQENTPFFGIIYQFMLILGVGWLPTTLFKSVVLFGALAALNAKYLIHLTQFLAIGFPVMFFDSDSPTIRSLPIAGVIIGLVLSSSIAFAYPPTAEEAAAAQLAVLESGGATIYNDWATGHLVKYYGGRPHAISGGKWPDVNCTGCIKLTRKILDCKCLNCPSRLMVWEC